MMRTTLTLLGAMLLLPVLASADTTFTLTGDLTNGGNFSGQLLIQSGGLTHVSGTYTNGSYAFTLPASYLGENLGEGNFFLIDVFPVPAPQFDLSLYIPTTNILTYQGGSLCALYNNVCATGVYSHYQDQSLASPANFLHLTATAVSPTPEPSSLALLGTGLLCVTGGRAPKAAPLGFQEIICWRKQHGSSFNRSFGGAGLQPCHYTHL